jgi:hypothetical protein
MMTGACISALVALGGCAGSERTTTASSPSVDTATWLAALSVNGDGSDEAVEGGTATEPVLAGGCGFTQILENVVERFDADSSGDLDAQENAALTAEYGDLEAGVSAEHPNQGQPGKLAALLGAYDSDGSGILEATEIATLQADIEARCEARLAKLVEEFDVDGDGELDETEWAAARAALRERFAGHRLGRVAEFDADGDGQLDAGERAIVREQARDRRDQARARFDADGDGEIGEDERAAFGEHVRACVRDDVPVMSDGEISGGRGEEAAADSRGHGRGRPGSDEAEAVEPAPVDETSGDESADVSDDESADTEEVAADVEANE